MNLIKNFLFFGGLNKETYKNVKTRINEENRNSNNIFTVLSSIAFLIMGISTNFHNEGIPSYAYLICVGVLLIILILNITLGKKFPIICDFFAVGFSVILLAIGVFLAVGQKEDRTTTLLPLFALVSLVFCYRPIYLICILTATEVTYLVIMSGVQSSDLFFVNLVNTLIFSFVGMVGGLYTLYFKHKKHEADYEKQVLSETDALTGLLNRYCWNKELTKIESNRLNVAICSIDVNDLKKTNDTKGHLAGDKLIIAAANCIKSVFKDYGQVYRIGGDEFSVLIYEEYEEQTLRDELKKATRDYKGNGPDGLSVSFGIAKLDYNKNISVINTVHLADKQMYAEKKKYHDEQVEESESN